MTSSVLVDQSSHRKRAEQRVVKIAGYLRVGTGLLLLMCMFWIVFFAAWIIWSPTAAHDASLYQQLISDGKLQVTVNFVDAEFTMAAKLVIAAIGLLLVMYTFYLFSRLHALFGNFRHKKIFTKRNSQVLRHLGYALIIGYTVGKVLQVGVVIAAGVLSGEGWWVLGSLQHTVGVTTILMVLMIGLVFLTAWILDIGRDLYIDAELTI